MTKKLSVKETDLEKGIIYGVSVGPGNPMLMTQLAVKIIDEVDIIFLPTAPKESCRSYKILKMALPHIDECKVKCVETNNMADPKLQDERYDILAAEIKKFADKGLSVAFLALGEIALYSTFIYVQKRLIASGYNVKTISGISSVQEAVNTIGTYIAIGDEEVHIFPNCDNIKEKLGLSGTKVFMKPKRNLDTIIKEITEYAKLSEKTEVFGVSDIGTENEIVANSVSELSNLKGYMTLFIVRN